MEIDVGHEHRQFVMLPPESAAAVVREGVG
jgi:hypothetical protein